VCGLRLVKVCGLRLVKVCGLRIGKGLPAKQKLAIKLLTDSAEGLDNASRP